MTTEDVVHACESALATAVEAADIATAERDRAVDLLRGLEDILRRIGGYMSPEDQHVLFAARAFLAGVR